MSTSLLTLHAREALAETDDWYGYAWEFGTVNKGKPSKTCPVGHYRIDGARYLTEPHTRADYTHSMPGTNRTYIVIEADQKQWEEDWSLRTGHCIRCTGDGRTVKHWNHITGIEYRPCPDCRGTGKRPPTPTETDTPTP